jgi:hypothetical protein
MRLVDPDSAEDERQSQKHGSKEVDMYFTDNDLSLG